MVGADGILQIAQPFLEFVQVINTQDEYGPSVRFGRPAENLPKKSALTLLSLVNFPVQRGELTEDNSVSLNSRLRLMGILRNKPVTSKLRGSNWGPSPKRSYSPN